MVSFIQNEQHSTLPKKPVALLKHCVLTTVLCNGLSNAFCTAQSYSFLICQ